MRGCEESSRGDRRLGGLVCPASRGRADAADGRSSPVRCSRGRAADRSVRAADRSFRRPFLCRAECAAHIALSEFDKPAPKLCKRLQSILLPLNDSPGARHSLLRNGSADPWGFLDLRRAKLSSRLRPARSHHAYPSLTPTSAPSDPGGAHRSRAAEPGDARRPSPPCLRTDQSIERGSKWTW